MSETDRLRDLLDARGVEYRWDNGTLTWRADGVMYNAWAYDSERLTMSVCHVTPEQAVEVAFGAPHRKTHTKEYCDRCEGAVLPKWKKCPWCGEPLEEV